MGREQRGGEADLASRGIFREAMRSAGARMRRERMHSGVSCKPLSSRTSRDADPVHAAGRTRAPAHRSLWLKARLATRHRDADAILRERRQFGNDSRERRLWPTGGSREPAVRRSRVARPGHAVADPALVDDVGRVGRVVAELAPELLHEGAHQLRIAVVPPAPHVAQQGVVG